MKTKTYLTLVALAVACPAAIAATTVAFEFNTPADTEGWSGIDGVSGLTTAVTTAGGTEGVLTSSDITLNDPKLTYNTTISLTSGEKWSTIEFRLRLLDDNPPAGSEIAFINSGTLILMNGSITTNSGAFADQTYGTNGGGNTNLNAFTMDIASDGGEWQKVTITIDGTSTFANNDITAVRFDPVGNDQVKNFEVDYIRFDSVPEPSSTALLGLGFGGLLLRRRR